MNNLEYLNQISKSSRPVKTGANAQGFGLIIKIAVAGVAVFIVLLVVGLLLGNKSNSTADLEPQIYLRTTNLEKTLTTYNKSLRSSKLRAINLTLSSTLTAATNQLVAISKDASSNKDLVASETEYINELNNTLNTAKLNGALDRTYANQMQLQTALLITMLEQALNHTSSEELKGAYSQYLANLTTANTDLVNYSSSSD